MSVHIKKGSAISSLPMTPLIDMVFLLLIFFLVATRFAEEEQRELRVNLAEASQAEPLTSRPKDLYITIDRQGQYRVAGRPHTADQLFDALRRAYSRDARASAVVRADRDCRWQPIATVFDLCKRARVPCRVVTQEPSSPPS